MRNVVSHIKMKTALLIILLSVLNFSLTFAQCGDVSFAKFQGLHQTLPDNLFDHLEKEQAKKVTWYWDEKNQKDGEFNIYPFYRVGPDEYIIHISKYPKSEGYNYLLLADTKSKIAIRDTTGPFLDSFPDKVAVGNITSQEDQEILIKLRSEFEEQLIIYSQASNDTLASFHSNTTNLIFVEDIDSNGQCEVILNHVSIDDDLLPNVGLDKNPSFATIYSWSGETFKVANHEFKSFLKNRIPGYKSAIRALETRSTDSININSTFDASLKAQLVDTLESWIHEIENY